MKSIRSCELTKEPACCPTELFTLAYKLLSWLWNSLIFRHWKSSPLLTIKLRMSSCDYRLFLTNLTCRLTIIDKYRVVSTYRQRFDLNVTSFNLHNRPLATFHSTESSTISDANSVAQDLFPQKIVENLGQPQFRFFKSKKSSTKPEMYFKTLKISERYLWTGFDNLWIKHTFLELH